MKEKAETLGNDSKGLQSEVTFKVLFTGEPSVGKTNLLYEYTDSYKPTIDFNLNVIRPKSFNHVRLQIWDISGKELPKEVLANRFYRDAKVVLIMFDTTNVASLNKIENDWINQAKDLAPDASLILVGTKADLQDKRAISYKKANDYAQQLGIPYIETSAKTKTNREALFKIIAELLIAKFQNILPFGIESDSNVQTQDSSQVIELQQPTQVSKPKTTPSGIWKFFSCCAFNDHKENAPNPSSVTNVHN